MNFDILCFSDQKTTTVEAEAGAFHRRGARTRHGASHPPRSANRHRPTKQHPVHYQVGQRMSHTEGHVQQIMVIAREAPEIVIPCSKLITS